MANTLSVGELHASSNRARLDSDAVMQARVELAACFQLAAQRGLEEGVCNHFSAVVPGHEDLFFVNPYGYAFAEVTASRLLVCDFEGHVIAGEGKPEATAFYIHARLHRLKPRRQSGLPYAYAECDCTVLARRAAASMAGPDGIKVLRPYRSGRALQRSRAGRSEGDRIAWQWAAPTCYF